MADEAHNSSLRGCISLPLLKNGKVNLGIQRRPGDSNHPQGVVKSSPRLNRHRVFKNSAVILRSSKCSIKGQDPSIMSNCNQVPSISDL